MLSHDKIRYLIFSGLLSFLSTFILKVSPTTSLIILCCLIATLEIIRLPRKRRHTFLQTNEGSPGITVAHKLGSIHSGDHIEVALHKAGL